MRIPRLIFVLALTAAMLPNSAPAWVMSTCGGNYSGNASCTLMASGPSFGVSGTSSGGVVLVELRDITGQVVLMQCRSEASTASSCSAHWGPGVGVVLVHLNLGGPLQCRVTGSGSGVYGCTSFT